MNEVEIQKKEIETIAPRTFELKLSDADVIRIYEKAAGASMTPGELLESFIGDLVNGTYTNGSDERALAGEWFDRCGFSFDPYETFLAYLVNEFQYDFFTEMQDDITEFSEDIEFLDISDFDSAEDYEEEEEYLQMLLQDAKDAVQEMFDEYCRLNENHKTMEQEAELVFKFRENLKNALAHKNERTV